MSYFVYENPAGVRHVLTHKLPKGTEGDFRLVMESDVPPVLPVRAPSYQENRRSSYPPLGDQLDMLWHAMASGQMPKVEPFFSEIQAIKDRYPKQSN